MTFTRRGRPQGCCEALQGENYKGQSPTQTIWLLLQKAIKNPSINTSATKRRLSEISCFIACGGKY